MQVLTDNDLLKFIGKQESQSLVVFDDYLAETKKRFEGGKDGYGDELPWERTNQDIRLRPQEVSLWAGVNGHGKSLMLSHVMAHLMKSSRVLIASMEMSIPAQAERMFRQISGSDKPTEPFIDLMSAWTNGRLWLYDQQDTVPPEKIIGMCMYAMAELDISHIVIDSLVKCGIRPDDYAGQKTFVDKLCFAAKTYGGHIHLVHHIRKGDKESNLPDKFDIKGAGEITDLVDNVFIVHRNKVKEEKAQGGEPVDEFDPDAILVNAKQRHGEWEGKVPLYFDKASTQYLQSPRANKEWFPIEVQDEVG